MGSAQYIQNKSNVLSLSLTVYHALNAINLLSCNMASGSDISQFIVTKNINKIIGYPG